MARGFSQIEGIDYEETFAPVARYSSIRTILALSVHMGWHIHQMDVKIVFLNGITRKKCTLSSLKDLRSSPASRMCVDSKERRMG